MPGGGEEREITSWERCDDINVYFTGSQAFTSIKLTVRMKVNQRQSHPVVVYILVSYVKTSYELDELLGFDSFVSLIYVGDFREEGGAAQQPAPPSSIPLLLFKFYTLQPSLKKKKRTCGYETTEAIRIRRPSMRLWTNFSISMSIAYRYISI